MNYIKVEAIQSKLKAASRNNQILYICGSVGMGKTAAVEYYFRRKPHVIFPAARAICLRCLPTTRSRRRS